MNLSSRRLLLCLTVLACAMLGTAYSADNNLSNQGVAEQKDAPAPDLLGDSAADLVYTPVTPCRILDTRIVGGPIAAGGQRNFLVTGTNLSGQGGSATGCGVPTAATAAVINFVAV